MKHYMELDSRLLEKIETLKLVLETEFGELRAGEALLWAAAGADGTHEFLEATNDLPDTVMMSVVPPFPGNASLVISSTESSQTIQQRLGGAGWAKSSAKGVVELRRYLERHHSKYWRSLAPEKQDTIIAAEVAAWEVEKRRRDEDERYLTSLSAKQREREEKRRDEERLAAMKPAARKQELARRRMIHFGTLRIPMGEMVTFIKTRENYMVASGSGRPDSGGTLLSVPGEGLFSIRLLTRRLMGREFDEGGDVWALWEYKGETLRNIYARMFPGD